MWKFLLSLRACIAIFLCLTNFVYVNAWAINGQANATNNHPVFTTAAGQTIAVSSGLIIKFKAATSITNQLNALKSSGCRSTATFNLVSTLRHASITSSRSLSQTLALLRANPDVEYAEPNAILSAAVIPNDPQFINLYGLDNNAQTGGVVNADIDAPEAWDIHTGSNIIVAVIDTGLDYTHIDLLGNVWQNTAEIPGNGIDDDGNGFIDDTRGWDFINNDNDPMDDNDHGTHVSGTIAATGNNNIGVTGINWSARIMPLKFMSATGAGSTVDAIAAIDYAVANGARVINASWGGPFASTALSDAIAAANAAGVLFVAAAGNAGTDNDVLPNYPANYDIPNVISVAATDANDTMAIFSNTGRVTVDLAAPGSAILSTIIGNGYASFSGTSMATPHVVGVATLALALEPTLTVVQLKNAILNNVDSIASLAATTLTGGRLNAFKTLNSITPAPPPVITITVLPDTAVVPVGGNIQFSATGSSPPYTWSSNSTIASITSAGGLLTATAAGVTSVTATDGAGNSGSSGNIDIIQVQISPTGATLSVGATQQFIASGGFPPYVWSSSSATLASVSAATGVLTALAAGTVTLSVVDNVGATATTSNITITQPGVLPLSAILATNDTLQFSASGGSAPYTWSTTNPTVASINASSGLLTALSAGTTTITATDANGTPASSGNIIIRTINLSPQTAAIITGNTLQFTAAGGAVPYTWSSSNPTIADFNVTTGLLTALSPGTVVITTTDNDNISGTSGTITISDPPPPPPPAALTIAPQTATLAAAQTVQFSSTGGTAPYIWRSSNTAVATISATTGLLTAVSAGTTLVTVTDNTGTTLTSGTVTATQSQVSPNSAVLAVSQTLQFSALGGVAPYSWTSSNTAIASINVTTGLLTTLSAGSVTVTATDSLGQTAATASIVISDVIVSPQTTTMNTGSSQLFSAAGGTAPYTWVSSNTTIATINTATGLLTAISPGSTIISATDANNITGSSNLITVVTPPPPVIAVTAPVSTINVGDTLQLSATGGSTPYTWAVDNTILASIGITNGLLTGLAAGTVVVTATDAGNFSGSSSVITILAPVLPPAPPPPAPPALPPQVLAQTSLLAVTSTVQISVTDGTAPFTWVTSNPNTSFTIINATTIQLTAIAAGSTSVTVTDASSISATTAPIEFRAISVISPLTSVDVGATLQMTATGGRAPFTWVVDLPAVATINAIHVLTGVAAGSVTVTATDSDNFSGSTVITVINPLNTINIAPLTAPVAVGDTFTFSIINAPFGNMMQAGALVWSSSQPAVATVSNFGFLTALSSGSTIVTVSDGAGNFGTLAVAIDPPPPVAVTPLTASVTAGNWLQFFATGGTNSYTWTTSDAAIATIDLNGWLFGVAAGSVTVTATDTAGGIATTGVITIAPGGRHGAGAAGGR